MTLWDEFVDAYLDNNIEHRWFLDLEQGIVVIDWDEATTDWDDPRYVSIPQCTSSEAYSWRERFAAQDSSGRLEDALTRNRPFRHFKDALTDLQLWDAWNAYERQCAERELHYWVEDLPIPYEVLNERYQDYWRDER